MPASPLADQVRHVRGGLVLVTVRAPHPRTSDRGRFPGRWTVVLGTGAHVSPVSAAAPLEQLSHDRGASGARCRLGPACHRAAPHRVAAPLDACVLLCNSQCDLVHKLVASPLQILAAASEPPIGRSRSWQRHAPRGGRQPLRASCQRPGIAAAYDDDARHRCACHRADRNCDAGDLETEPARLATAFAEHVKCVLEVVPSLLYRSPSVSCCFAH